MGWFYDYVWRGAVVPGGLTEREWREQEQACWTEHVSAMRAMRASWHVTVGARGVVEAYANCNPTDVRMEGTTNRMRTVHAEDWLEAYQKLIKRAKILEPISSSDVEFQPIVQAAYVQVPRAAGTYQTWATIGVTGHGHLLAERDGMDGLARKWGDCPFPLHNTGTRAPHAGEYVDTMSWEVCNRQHIEKLAELHGCSKFVRDALMAGFSYQKRPVVVYNAFVNWLIPKIASVCPYEKMVLFLMGQKGEQNPLMAPAEALATATSASLGSEWYQTIIRMAAKGIADECHTERVDFDPDQACTTLRGRIIDYLHLRADVKAGMLLEVVAKDAGFERVADGWLKEVEEHQAHLSDTGRLSLNGRPICIVHENRGHDMPHDDNLVNLILALQRKDRVKRIYTLQGFGTTLDALFPLSDFDPYDAEIFHTLEALEDRDIDEDDGEIPL